MTRTGLKQHEHCRTEFDHHGPAFAANPPGELKRLYDICPVTWSEQYGGFWIVTGYDEAFEILRDDATYSSADGVSIPPLHRHGPPIDVDPPLLGTYRSTLAPKFSPGGIEPIRELAEQWTAEAVAELARQGHGDLVRELGAPIPAKAIMTLLGLPIENWPRYADVWHDIFASPQDPEVYEALSLVRDELADYMARWQQCPVDDVMSRLLDQSFLDPIASSLPAGFTAVDEGVEVCVTLLGAGVDTTTNLFASTAVWLAGNPDARRRLAAEPELMTSAVDEFLRFFSVAPALARTVTRDVKFFGHEFHAGERVLVSFMGANRDPRAFDRADEVILDRRPNRHMAFGVGLHRCIGSNLAKLVFPIMLRHLLEAFPEYTVEVDDTMTYADQAQVTGWSSVPFTAGAVPAGASA